MNNDAIRFRRSIQKFAEKKATHAHIHTLINTFEKLVNERGNVNGNEWSFLESRELDE